MFDYSYNFKLPCQECTAAEFEKLTTSDRVRNAIRKARECEAAIDALPVTIPAENDERRKQLEAEKAKAKQALPCLMFQATFRESENKYGKRARWRNNNTAVLNGLFIIDIDHIRNPKDEWLTALGIAEKKGLRDIFMLAFVTASGHGLKLVCKADAARGGIAENQKWLCDELCITYDEACKDAARVSFCPAKEDILFINNEIFEYNNEGFGKNITSAPKQEGTGERVNESKEPAAENTKNDFIAVKDFHGVPYTRIVEAWDAVKGGRAAVGERHHRLQQMAVDFRHICDMDYNQLVWVMRQSATAKEIEGRKPGEVEELAAGALRLRNSVRYPAAIVEACKNCGISLDDTTADGHPLPQDEIDYDYWWSRLRPLLHTGEGDEEIRDPYAAAVAGLDDKIKLGGVLVAGAMLGTYLSRCTFKYFDAKLYRLSYLVYVIGAPASGKSFIIDIDKMLMGEIKRQDEVWREKERLYAEQKEKNEQTKGTKESKVMAKPHFPVRYVPSTISNHVLYNRLRDAVMPDDAGGTHLHLFTLESELATALRAQVGSWAGKLDLELKSFQNEYAGVDFANTGSANGLIQINWNQVISTTADSMRKKVRGGSINDGYITRLALWVMPDTRGRMIPYQGDQPLKSGEKGASETVKRLDDLCRKFQNIEGVLPCEPLVRCAYDWCEEQCEKVTINDDALVDYFRNRIPLYMIRYTLPRIIARDYDLFIEKGELHVTEDDKAFARLIGDWLMYISIRTWGKALLDYWNNAEIEGTPRQRTSKLVEHYAELGDTFSIEDIGKYYSSVNSARATVYLLTKKGYIERVKKNTWKKLKASIDDVVATK